MTDHTRLEAINADLLAALESMMLAWSKANHTYYPECWDKALSAIVKALDK